MECHKLGVLRVPEGNISCFKWCEGDSRIVATTNKGLCVEWQLLADFEKIEHEKLNEICLRSQKEIIEILDFDISYEQTITTTDQGEIKKSFKKIIHAVCSDKCVREIVDGIVLYPKKEHKLFK